MKAHLRVSFFERLSRYLIRIKQDRLDYRLVEYVAGHKPFYRAYGAEGCVITWLQQQPNQNRPLWSLFPKIVGQPLSCYASACGRIL